MASDADWQESLGNIDDLISCVGSLETEDVIYLEEYLAGEGGLGSRSPSLWSVLRDSTGDESAGFWSGQEGVRRELPDNLVNEEEDELIDDPQVPPDTASCSDTVGTSLGPRKPRSTQGVSKPKFVSYQAFPSTKDKPFTCELCGRRLATRESRRRHIIAKHIKERNNVCSVCGKSFVFKFSLKTHAAIHSATPNFTCVCGQTFSVRGSYMNHVRRVHRAASEIKYSCELCFKSFVDHHTLRLHLISVHKPKTIACLHKGCNKVFSTDALMKSHYWYHLKQRFPCDECGQTFSTESYMYKHRRTHSGIRPYMCIDCGKTYLSVSHLNKHRRVAHSSYRPFQCSFCGKCYKTKDQLNYHESTHRGEKPFRCEVCGYATAYRHTYYAHRKKHQTTSSGSSPQKKGKGDSSSTGTTASGDKTSGAVKKREKNKHQKKSPSKHKHSNGVVNNTVQTLGTTVSPQILELSTACGNASTGLGMSVSPATTSVNVICVVSSEPNTINVLPDISRTISTSFPIQIESQSKDLQSPSSESFLSSEPLGVLQPTETDTEESYSGSQLDSKLDYELVANSDMPEESSRNFSEDQSCIILSNAAKCSVPACESDGKSLLLFKIDDDSYVALCTHHSLTDHATDTEKEATQCKESVSANLCAQVLNSPSGQEPSVLGSDNMIVPQEARNVLSLKVDPTEANLSESVVHSQLLAKPVLRHSREDSSLIQLISQSAATPEGCISNMSATEQIDNAKPSSEVCLSEHFSSMMELDTGLPGLSGPIVDETFSLAQIEVHCPLCEEQFLCMDDYVTHLESCHS